MRVITFEMLKVGRSRDRPLATLETLDWFDCLVPQMLLPRWLFSLTAAKECDVGQNSHNGRKSNTEGTYSGLI